MKKNFCSFLLSFMFSFLFFIGNNSQVVAQSYIPIPDSNAYWRLTDGTITDLFFTDSVKNDTVINSKIYTELFYKYISGTYAGCYRNDILNKKVFYIPPDSTQEFLLYDFAANIGDTVNVIHKNQSFPSFPSSFQMRKIVVDSVVYRTIGPRNHKRIYLSTSNDMDMWTEGIGNINGIVSVYSWNSQILWCMSYDDTVYYSNNFSLSQENNYFYGRCDTVSVPLLIEENVIVSSIKIFPSISSSTISINSPDVLYPLKIIIYNSLGLLYKTQLMNENSLLSIDDYSSGIYLIQILSNDKKYLSTKFIKQ